MDEGVDVVVFRDVREFVGRILGNREHLRADGVGVEARHDEGFAAFVGGDEAGLGDLGGAFVVGDEGAEAGDVAVGAVGVTGAHGELLRRAGAFEHGLGRINFHVHHRGHIARVFGRAGLQPLNHGLVEIAVGFDGFAAGVLHAAGGFFEEEAVVGEGEIDAATDLFARDAVVIAIGIEAEHGEAEAVLAAR